jgi:Leucine-rich repeat (LRR) protein
MQKQAFLSALLTRKRTLEGPKINANDLYIDRIDENIPSSLIAEIYTLYLSNNHLYSLVGLPQFINLRVLSVANNNIRYYEDLDILSKLKHLEKLTLDKNPVTYLPYYREYILALCPKLTALDDCKLNNHELSHSRDNIAKLRNYIDQFALVILRNTTLSHFIMKQLCHEAMFTDVFPSYR